MRNLNTLLLALTVGAGSLLAAPLALADKYEIRNYYGESRYDADGDRRHRNQRRCTHEVVNYYHEEPVRERVVVVERPVYYEQPARYYEEPPRDYRDEQPYYPPQRSSGEYRSATPMIVGGIIGGVLGHQVGKGRGRDVATVAGTILGGSVGRDMGYYHQ